MPVVYDGRVRPVDEAAVVADIDQLVAAGARHVTFADPDFLNAPLHARRVIAAMHERHPSLTFDCTIKVEHILRHPDVLPSWPKPAAHSSFRPSSRSTTRSSATSTRVIPSPMPPEPIVSLREHGIEVRPSWLPFTPWTTLDDLVDLIDFVVAHDLVANVDPVQYTVRLLLPEGSLLLGHAAMTPHLGHYRRGALGLDLVPSRSGGRPTATGDLGPWSRPGSDRNPPRRSRRSTG